MHFNLINLVMQVCAAWIVYLLFVYDADFPDDDEDIELEHGDFHSIQLNREEN